MTSQYDFSNAEWSDIASLPVLVGYAIAKAEDSGFLGSLRELRTLSASIEHEAPEGDAKALIEAVTLVDVKDKIDKLEDLDPELLGDIAVQACIAVSQVLHIKASPAETAGFQSWVLAIAKKVAATAKEHGVRISEPESALLARLTVALEQA